MNTLIETLPARYYTDPEIANQEQNTIFYHSWQYGCHKSELPNIGSFKTVRAGREEIFLIRGKDNQIRAFYNVCPHRAHRLVKGQGERQMIVCPYHAWSFYANGQLCNARGCGNIEGFKQQNYNLRQVKTEEVMGFIFINLNLKAQPLSSQLGDFEKEIREFVPDIDKLVFAHKIDYEIKSNWKVVVDNYLECYHCPATHPDFSDLVNMRTYRSQTCGIYSKHIGQIAAKENSAYRITSSNQSTFGGWWLWPNMSFTVFPGSPNISVMNMVPNGPDQTLESFEFFFLNSQPSEEEWASINYIREKLQPEDIDLVESVQQGLHSRSYNQGPLVIDPNLTEISEHALAHFHGLVSDHLNLTENYRLASPPLVAA